MLGVGRTGPTATWSADGASDGMMPGPTRAPEPSGAPDPTTSEREAWVLLNGADGVGPVSFARLVEAFGSAHAVLAAASAADGPRRLVEASAGHGGQSQSLSRASARAIAEAAGHPDRHLEAVRRAGVRVVTLADSVYPARLRRIGLPPPVLFLRGDLGALDRTRAVAVVGTRRPTAVGRATAARIADAVSGLGATVISGLALGIDACAHVATVRSGRPTVAVIGGGHEHLYPAGHRGLARSIIAAGGAVVSEFAPETVPSRGTFPRRNRIISGLADATVVVEAGARSGALTTAAWALEQGRSLHIVPGRLDDPAVAGCLAFLREAGPEARVVAGVPELIEDLGLIDATGPRAAATGYPRPRKHIAHLGANRSAGSDGGSLPSPRPPRLDAVLSSLPPVEREVARHVVAGRSSVDELVAVTGLAAATVLGTITALEMRGLIVDVFGRSRAAGALAAARRAG
jgi:DNA processing protein